MLRITRIDGRENYISEKAEKPFMMNILNKTDRNVTKVERGELVGTGENRKFNVDEDGVIWVSKTQETKDLARKATQMAVELDKENQNLKAQLEALQKGKPINSAEIEKAKAEAEKAIALAEKAKAEAEEAEKAKAAAAQEAGSAAEKVQVLEHTLASKDEEIEALKAKMKEMEAKAAKGEKPAK